jgi:hypothetical protein
MIERNEILKIMVIGRQAGQRLRLGFGARSRRERIYLSSAAHLLRLRLSCLVLQIANTPADLTRAVGDVCQVTLLR